MGVAARNRARYPPRVSSTHEHERARPPPPPPVFPPSPASVASSVIGTPDLSRVPPPPPPDWPPPPASDYSARSEASDLSRVLDGAGRRGKLVDQLPRAPLVDRPRLREGWTRAREEEEEEEEVVECEDDFLAFQTRPSKAPVRRVIESVSSRALGAALKGESEEEKEEKMVMEPRRMGRRFFTRSGRALYA